MKHNDSSTTFIDWVWGSALALAVTFTYAWVQNADEAAHKVEMARAKSQGYHAGYNTGSNAGLVAAYQACKNHLVLNHCDQVLASAVVVAADGAQ